MQNVCQRVCRFAHRISIWSVAVGSAAGMFSAGPAAAAPPSLLIQNLLVQQGLAIGLLQTMIWAELDVGFGQHSAVGNCVALPQGGDGSLKTLARTNGGNNFTVELYYDNACTKLYVHAVATAAGGSPITSIQFKENLTYYGVNGAKLGTAKVMQRVGNSPQGSHFSQISDVGTFTSVHNGLPVHFGVDCAEPTGEPGNAVIHCNGGVAQSIPLLGEDIASVAPLTVTLTQIGGAAYSSKFTGKNGKLVHGSNLGIAAPTTHSLAITGASTNVGTSTTNGSVGLLSPFLGAPAQWTVSDTGDNAKFTIALHDVEPPVFVGSVMQVGTSAKIATVRVDIGGNGSVVFSNNKKVKIANWMMVN